MLNNYKLPFRTYVIFILVSFAAITSSLAQPCHGVNLLSQASVNSFKNLHCTKLTGELYINGGDITNLDSLEDLTEIGGLIINSSNLSDLRGLHALEKINGNVHISFNQSLTSMSGLDRLELIAGNFFLDNNNNLATLVGLNNLRKVEGSMWVSDSKILSMNGLQGLDSVRNQFKIEANNSLQTLDGLDNLISAGSMRIEQNMTLTSLGDLSSLTTLREGLVIFLNLAMTEIGNLENLKHIGHQMWISYNPEIKSLNGLKVESVTGDPSDLYAGIYISDTKIEDLKGLENLDHTHGRLYIGYNYNLKTFDGLDNLRFVDGHFGIEDNITLTSIDAIADIEYISGELELNDNDSLQLCSVKSICNYLSAPPGLILIWGNGPGCTTPEEILSNCSPVVDFHMVDANLEVDTSTATTGDIRNLSVAALLSLDEQRAGVATDGVSSILFRLTTGTKGYIDIANAEEKGIEFPWGDTTHYLKGKNYLFFLYNAPDEFDELEQTYMYEDVVEAYDTQIDYTFTSGSDVRQNNFTITQVRPPVVLMHGTYSSPDKTWRTAAAEGASMYDRLTGEGFSVFTVNYEQTNGTVGIAAEDKTSFADNARVLWGDVYPENTGGIKDALTHYRENLNLAVTQADVVGHSLGGVLPRVYASDHYNPEYKRPENFMEGDINRLITIASTHFGSDLGDLHIWLEDLTAFDIGLLDWMVVETVGSIADVLSGTSPSKAVIDQRPLPAGTELNLIGRTEIPSHAITLSVPKGALKDSIVDPDESYYDLYWYLTTMMYQLNDVRTEYLDSKLALIDMGLQAGLTISGENPADLYPYYTNYMLYKSMIEDAVHRAGTLASILDGTFELPSDIEIFKYAFGEAGMGDIADPLLDIFIAGADPVGVALDYFIPDIQFPTVQSILEDQLRVNEATMELIRSLIFNNDLNDGVVRVESQSGQLEKECPTCVTHFDNVLHGFAPRYPAVQDHLVQLLRSDFTAFSETGFPPVDHALQIYYPPQNTELFKVPVSGGEAICQSGLVPSHARAFAHIADQNNVIIMTRPVNPDGTGHIANHAATKGVEIKPKSSNWGPQKGFIPVQQRYSKLWQMFEGSKRDEKIAEYDQLAQENLNEGVAVGRPLVVSICDELFKVYVDQNRIGGPEDMNAEDEVVIVPLADPTLVCYWGEEFRANEIIEDCEAIGPQHQLVEMPVLASPFELEDDGVTPRFLTADYDLLMVGFYEGPDQGPPAPPVLDFQPGYGQITEEQKTLLHQLNAAVHNTGYRGGKVVHHGPENQFSKSPYIDYPVTVFAPDHIPNGIFNHATDGLILSIESGPPGFRDQNLKQFVNRMRKEGYDLYDNPSAPGWKWTWNMDAEAYQLEDSKDLPDYVEQLPKNACDKFGGQVKEACAFLNADAATNDRPGSFVKGNADATGDIIFKISPTIVYDQPVTFTIDAATHTFSWMILDAFGNVSERGNIPYGQKRTEISIDVSNLGSGVYTVITDMYGEAGRFVKF